jgi:adenylyl-sulfate kinase
MATRRPKGLILWFTGWSGAGKSTLARRLQARLAPHRPVELLDGDEVRRTLSAGLGFSREDRDTNVRRIGFVARAVARTGAVSIVAAISPYADARDEQRASCVKDDVVFIEIHVHAPLGVLVERDRRGLYAKALAGKLERFTGVNDPYEPPLQPELSLDTSVLKEDACVAAILGVIEKLA